MASASSALPPHAHHAVILATKINELAASAAMHTICQLIPPLQSVVFWFSDNLDPVASQISELATRVAMHASTSQYRCEQSWALRLKHCLDQGYCSAVA